MTRIVAGSVGGRRLAVPAGTGTRPTSDRVREALFSRLEHAGVLQGAVVLDLYAGSGALGLEAASRGATSVVLVEADRKAAAAARANIASLGLPRVRLVTDRVERYLAAGPHDVVTLALLDPPYRVEEAELANVLALLARWLAPDAAVVLERGSRSPRPDWPTQLEEQGERRYGETRLWFARRC